jgi:hypothetical protein
VASKDAYRALFKLMAKKMDLTKGQQGQLLQFLDDVGTWDAGSAASTTAHVPAGGTDGQVLTKNSDDDYDTEWA